jgi:hypothetical protein
MNVNVFFSQFFKKSHSVYDQIQCSIVHQFYYTHLMIIHSCKSILINCGCMFGWVFFFAMDHVIGLSPKTLWKFPFPENKFNIVLHLLCFTRSYKII